MRIIAGIAKGHLLKAPKGFITRPTTDRIREALFNILYSRVLDAEVLDLFAGTGALGIEALSRGAARADFVERCLPAFKCIKHNLAKTKLQTFARVIYGDAFSFLNKCALAYDLIFIDPPYQQNLAEQALQIVAQNAILKPDGIAIAETGKAENLPEQIGELRCVRQVRYGDTLLWFYHLAKEEEK